MPTTDIAAGSAPPTVRRYTLADAEQELFDYGAEHWTVTRAGVERDCETLQVIANILHDAFVRIGKRLDDLDSPSTTTFDFNGRQNPRKAFDVAEAVQLCLESALDDFLTGPAQRVVLAAVREGVS